MSPEAESALCRMALGDAVHVEIAAEIRQLREVEGMARALVTDDTSGRKYKESWEEYCRRKTLESQDSIRLYHGVAAIVPLLRALSEAGDIDSVLSGMTVCTYADARKELIRWLRENHGTDSVAPILRAFDMYSV
jgi:hypothetical protein